jgi:hypothetical protein
MNILHSYHSVLLVLSDLSVTISHLSGPTDIWKFVFSYVMVVWINYEIIWNMFGLILKYVQNFSSWSFTEDYKTPGNLFPQCLCCISRNVMRVTKRLNEILP